MRRRRVRGEKMRGAYLEALERRVMLDSAVLPVSGPQDGGVDATSQYVFKMPVTASVTVTHGTLTQSPVLQVQLSGFAGTPMGIVEVYAGDTRLITGLLQDGEVTLLPGVLSEGEHVLTLYYRGDMNYGVWTESVIVEVAQATPTVSLTMTTAATSTTAPAFGVSVTGSKGTPTGTVRLYEGETLLATGTLLSNGSVTITTGTLPVGTYTIVAEYVGDVNYGAGWSETLLVSVEKVVPTANVQLSLMGQTTTFRVWMTDTKTNPTGTVELYEGETLLGSAVLSDGEATVAVDGLALGPHVIVAKYFGDDVFASCISAVLPINVTMISASVSISMPAGRPPSQTTLNVLIGSLFCAPTGTIDLYDGETLIASMPVTAASTSIVVPLALGDHSITARYSGDERFSPADSKATTITVKQTTLATVNLAASQTAIRDGDSVTLTASVYSGWGLNGGTVTFYDVSTPIGSVPINAADEAVLNTVVAGTGQHRFTATYEENVDHLPSTSAVVTVQVGPAVTTTINLMVLYTWDLLSTTIDKVILDAVNSVNVALFNSLLPIEVVLVHWQAVDYVSSGNYNKDLIRLADPNDGYMDEVAYLRNEWQADLVSLFVGQMDKSSAIGLGYTLTTLSGNVDAAFSVIYAWNAGAPTYTLAHELGHNFGALHDAENNTLKKTVFTTGLGWRFYGNNSTQYRDIMSYYPGTIIPYYSNPLVNYQGVPTGTATANAAGVILTTAPIIANYRTLLPSLPLRYQPIGAIETANGLTITGWGFDQDAGKKSVKVRLVIDGVMSDPFTANQTRNDLTAQLGSPKHGWTYALPSLTAGEHTIELYVQDAPWTSWVKVDERTFTTEAILPDLTVSLGSISSSYATCIPGDWITVPVTITNTGLAAAVGTKADPILVDLQWSNDDDYHNWNTLVQQLKITSSIPAGGSVTVNAKFQVPTDTRSGSGECYLTAKVGSHTTVSAEPLNVVWCFGTIPGRKGSVSLTFYDSDGTKVTVSLKGPGIGTLDPDGWSIDITGTTAASTLTITASKSKAIGDNGRCDIGSILIHGNIGSVAAKTTNLNDLIIEGTVRNISLGNARGNLTIAPPPDLDADQLRKATVNISLDDAGYAILTSQIAIGTLQANNWNGGQIQAPTLNRLTIKGDSIGSVLTLDAYGDENVNYTVLGSATITGFLGSAYHQFGKSSWYILGGGKVGKITAKSGDLELELQGSINSITLSDRYAWDQRLQIIATGNIGTLTVRGRLEDSFIIAANIGTLTVNGAFNYSWIDCQGSINKLSLGDAMYRSGVYSDTINKLTLTYLGNSSIIANTIDSVKLTAINDDGKSGIFGFLADVKSYTGPSFSGNYISG